MKDAIKQALLRRAWPSSFGVVKSIVITEIIIASGGGRVNDQITFLTWVDELISEYSDEKKQLELYRQTIERKHVQGRVEAEVISGMISEMRYALQWMRKGRRPGHRRGIERTKVYNRSLFSKLVQSQMPEVSESEKTQIVDALFDLSVRERKCFILHMAYGLTFEEIAGMLKLSKSSVRTFIGRAKRKLESRQV